MGGRKLVSLLDMKEYFAGRVLYVAQCLEHCKFCSVGDFKKTPDGQKEIADYLAYVDSDLRFLGLELTRVYAERLRSSLAEVVSKDTLADDLVTLDGRLRDELAAIYFFHITPEQKRYYNKTDLFGETFKANFPTANSEVIEAGNCFAFGRHTACVYHLMRSMEIALRVLFVSLGMPQQIWSITKWNKVLDRIKGKIEKNNKNLADDAAWQADRAFYESAHAFIAALRVPIRNATMHVESTYDETGAENVFGAVKSFMRHIADKLKE
jgi:hypothetical protein